jgi:hypothetical protein
MENYKFFNDKNQLVFRKKTNFADSFYTGRLLFEHWNIWESSQRFIQKSG